MHCFEGKFFSGFDTTEQAIDSKVVGDKDDQDGAGCLALRASLIMDKKTFKVVKNLSGSELSTSFPTSSPKKSATRKK